MSGRVECHYFAESLYGYEFLLHRMKEALGEDFDEPYWNDAKFCADYLTVSGGGGEFVGAFAE